MLYADDQLAIEGATAVDSWGGMEMNRQEGDY